MRIEWMARMMNWLVCCDRVQLYGEINRLIKEYDRDPIEISEVYSMPLSLSE